MDNLTTLNPLKKQFSQDKQIDLNTYNALVNYVKNQTLTNYDNDKYKDLIKIAQITGTGTASGTYKAKEIYYNTLTSNWTDVSGALKWDDTDNNYKSLKTLNNDTLSIGQNVVCIIDPISKEEWIVISSAGQTTGYCIITSRTSSYRYSGYLYYASDLIDSISGNDLILSSNTTLSTDIRVLCMDTNVYIPTNTLYTYIMTSWPTTDNPATHTMYPTITNIPVWI